MEKGVRLTMTEAREMLLELCVPVGTERAALVSCTRRILGEDLCARSPIPPFDRSPFDGYAFQAADTAAASPDHPVTLRVLGEAPAGCTPACTVLSGTAVKIFTGAPIPTGADAVIKHGNTVSTSKTVRITAPCSSGQNVAWAGEDMAPGDHIAGSGTPIGPGLVGCLASQGIVTPLVYRRPKIGLLSIGSELVDAKQSPAGAYIRNSNRHTMSEAIQAAGGDPVNMGTAGDDPDLIAARLAEGFDLCDAVLSTGGVSAEGRGFTAKALKAAGGELLADGIQVSPGGTCLYGQREDVLFFGLSGNPVSALVNFCAVVLPVLRKLCGLHTPRLPELQVALLEPYPEASVTPRLLRGKLEFTEAGLPGMRLPDSQSSGSLRSMIGINLLAMVPAGTPALPAGTVLAAFYLDRTDMD
ncbi:MAG: molybdopterin molybdotransferase MoeA [Clostridiales bacterium]|nr:molybdopterin molybdotransferase MoeA [Clostridiales bacterium]